jgi:hypothetical protein
MLSVYVRGYFFFQILNQLAKFYEILYYAFMPLEATATSDSFSLLSCINKVADVGIRTFSCASNVGCRINVYHNK